jgi:hypothetical protein
LTSLSALQNATGGLQIALMTLHALTIGHATLSGVLDLIAVPTALPVKLTKPCLKLLRIFANGFGTTLGNTRRTRNRV